MNHKAETRDTASNLSKRQASGAVRRAGRRSLPGLVSMVLCLAAGVGLGNTALADSGDGQPLPHGLIGGPAGQSPVGSLDWTHGGGGDGGSGGHANANAL